LGTVWISQLGFGPAEVDRLAEAIATVLQGCTPYHVDGKGGKELTRARVDYTALKRARQIVRELRGGPTSAAGTVVALRGEDTAAFLDYALTSDVAGLGVGESQPTHLFGPGVDLDATLGGLTATLHFDEADAAPSGRQALSDGYAQFDDVFARLPGPIVVQVVPTTAAATIGNLVSRVASAVGATDEPSGARVADNKPYFIGHDRRPAAGKPLPPFQWEEPADPPLLTTRLNGFPTAPWGRRRYPCRLRHARLVHQRRRRHAAVDRRPACRRDPHGRAGRPRAARTGFPESGDGQRRGRAGRGASRSIATSCLPDGSVVDDLMVYRVEPEMYLVVVNASSNDKDWAWLNAVNEGQVLIDESGKWARVQHACELRDLRDPRHGADCRVDIALQGPRSADALIALAGGDAAFAKRLKALPWAGVIRATPGGFDLIISRTGYTGERVAYELFIHPDRAVDLWNALLAAGESFGVKPCGLAARDSTRTEAGLPLYSHKRWPARWASIRPTRASAASSSRISRSLSAATPSCATKRRATAIWCASA
jgi:glycine hydroxymethyltransferase